MNAGLNISTYAYGAFYNSVVHNEPVRSDNDEQRYLLTPFTDSAEFHRNYTTYICTHVVQFSFLMQ